MLIVLVVCANCVGVQSVDEAKSILKSDFLDNNHQVNPESVIRLAYEEANKKLPDANLIFFSYVGTCSELMSLSQQYTFLFTKSSWRPLGTRTYSADVVINMDEETLEIAVEDVSEHYLSTIPMELTGEEIANAARLAQDALQLEGKCEGIIVLAKGNAEDQWGVRCGAPDETYVECMEIDLNTKTITPK